MMVSGWNLLRIISSDRFGFSVRGPFMFHYQIRCFVNTEPSDLAESKSTVQNTEFEVSLTCAEFMSRADLTVYHPKHLKIETWKLLSHRL
jgi:hypothetical protein